MTRYKNGLQFIQCRNGENKLLWFINRIEVERQKKNHAEEKTGFVYDATNLSTSLTAKDQSFPVMPGTRIASTALVNLALFEDLWYMVCARVRELYDDLNVRFQNGFIAAETVLHNFGSGGTSFGVWRSRDMVNLLQEHWLILMDKHLVGTLDHAVRNRNYEFMLATSNSKYSLEVSQPEEIDELEQRYETVLSSKDDRHTADKIPGLDDINHMSIADFVMRVWWKVEPTVEKESIEGKRNERLRMMARSQVKRRKSFNDLAEEALPNCIRLDNGMLVGALSCECSLNCHCKSICNFDPWDHCFCKSNPLFLQYLQQSDTENLVRDLLTKSYGQLSSTEHLFDAPSNSVAQLQVATAAFGYEENMIEASAGLRSAIENMQEAYVARKLEDEGTHMPKTPVKQKKVKDVYPLDFYNETKFFTRPSGSANKEKTHCTPPTPPMSRVYRTNKFIPSDKIVDAPLQLAPLARQKSSTTNFKCESNTTSIKGRKTPEDFASDQEASPAVTPPNPLPNRRYVLAGGNTPLEFRPEVSWPMKPPPVGGIRADKEQLFSALSRPSTIISFLGDAEKSGMKTARPSPSQSSIDSFDNKDNFGRKRIFIGLRGEVRKLFRRGSNQ